MSNKLVATQEDQYTRDQWLFNARWLADLSNGETVIMDDNRPGVEPASAWLRLKAYLAEEQGVRINTLRVIFRDNEQRPLPNNADGYFFRKSIIAFPFEQESHSFYLLGYLMGDTLRVQRWKIPELIMLSEDTRDINDPDKVGESLIRNP